MLTALGATLTVLLSLQLDQMLHGPWRALAESIGATQDVSRFGAEAAKGIGFLGAGTIIITARQQVKGLTTAAGLWASACLGLAIGAGFYSCAFICSAYIGSLHVPAAAAGAAAHPPGAPHQHQPRDRAHEHLGAIVAHLHDENIRIFDFAVNRNGTGPLASFLCQFSAILPERRDHPELLASCRRSRASSSSKRSEKGGCTMLHCFDPIRDMTFWAILARLTLAVVCGGLIGAEREIKRRPAGFRTHHSHLPRLRHHDAHEPVPALPAPV